MKKQAYIKHKLVTYQLVSGSPCYYLVGGKRYSTREFWGLMPDFVTNPKYINHHIFHW